MRHVLETGEMYTWFWWRDHLEDMDVDGRIIRKLIFRKWTGKALTGLIWFRIGTVRGLL